MSDVQDRLREVMDLVGRAQELLDLAVGKATRLTARDRELVRQHLLDPRNHLQASADGLRRKMEGVHTQGQETRRASAFFHPDPAGAIVGNSDR